MTKKLSFLSIFLVALFISTPLMAKTLRSKFKEVAPPPAGYSLIYIYRIKVPPGMRTPKVNVDGEPVLKLPNNSYSWFYISPGSHAIKTTWGFMAEVPELETVVKIVPNQTYFLKMKGSVKSMGLGKQTVYSGIEEVDRATAIAELQKVKKLSEPMVEKVGSGAAISSTATKPNAKQVFDKAPPAPAGYATVYIYRPDCPPSLRRASILIDDKEALKLSNKSYSWFYLREGRHSVKTSWGSIYRGVPKVNIDLDVAAGQSYFLRLSGTKVPMGTYDSHTSKLDPVTEGLAQKELHKIKKYSPANIQKVD